MLHLREVVGVLVLSCLAGCTPATPDELFAEAETALSAGELRTAEIHLKNLLIETPNHAPARVMLGKVLLAGGDAVGAEQHLLRALELGAPAADVHVALLTALVRRGEFQQALDRHGNPPALNNEDTVAALMLVGAAHRGLKDFASAGVAYRSALQLDADSPELRMDLAALLLETGRVDEARQAVAEILAAAPQYTPAILMRGAMEFRSGAYERAQASFEEAMRLEQASKSSPRYAAALVQLVETQLARKQLAEATLSVDELLSLNPQSPVARYLKARVETEQGNLDVAEQRLETVVAEFPEYWPAYTALGSINLTQDQLGQAQMYLQTAVTRDPADAAARIMLAQLHIKEGNLESAKSLFFPAGATPVSDSVFLALAGRMSRNAGQTDLASQLFEQSEQTAPQTAEELATLSNLYLGAGEFERAVRVANSSGLDDAASEQLSEYLATLASVQQGDLSAAAQRADRLIAAAPNAPWALYLRAMIALTGADYATARSGFLRTVELQPNHIPALLGAANAAAGLNDRAQAAEHLRRVLEIDSSQPAALLGLARLDAQARKFDEARSWLARAPETAERQQLEGEIAWNESEFADAANAFKRAFELAPNPARAMASFYAASRAELPEPETELEAWLQRSPDDVGVNFVLGTVATEKGDATEAIERYEAVLKGDPSHIGALNNLAWWYSERGDQRAVQLAERASSAAPNNPAIADTLGWAYLRDGDAAKGLPLLTKAAEALPNEADVQYHWAVALAETGDEARAATILEDLIAKPEDFRSKPDAVARLAALRRE